VLLIILLTLPNFKFRMNEMGWVEVEFALFSYKSRLG